MVSEQHLVDVEVTVQRAPRDVVAPVRPAASAVSRCTASPCRGCTWTIFRPFLAASAATSAGSTTRSGDVDLRVVQGGQEPSCPLRGEERRPRVAATSRQERPADDLPGPQDPVHRVGPERLGHPQAVGQLGVEQPLGGIDGGQPACASSLA